MPCIVNRVTFDDGILDAQMLQNINDDAGHRRYIFVVVGRRKIIALPGWALMAYNYSKITCAYTWYAHEISERFSIQNSPIKFNLICDTGHLPNQLNKGES